MVKIMTGFFRLCQRQKINSLAGYKALNRIPAVQECDATMIRSEQMPGAKFFLNVYT
jgi:hypothetical protein